MKRKYAPWYIGPGTGQRNGGKFAYLEPGKLMIGARHRPRTRNARERWFALRRPWGWRVRL